MGELEFLTGHVIFKLCYNQIYQLKAPIHHQIFLNLLPFSGNVNYDLWTAPYVVYICTVYLGNWIVKTKSFMTSLSI